MNRIMIIGCPGSGKTTLAKQLALKLNIPLIHLDVLHWRDNWQEVPKEEFDDLLLQAIQKDKWIVDGNYDSTINLRLKYSDTVIYLDYPRLVCLLGVLKRLIKGYGKSRSDMGGYCPEKFDFEFIQFVWKFNRCNRNRYLQMLSEARDKEIIILHSRKACAKFLRSL